MNAAKLSLLVIALLVLGSHAAAQQQAPSMIVDYRRPPASMEAAAEKAALVAVLRIGNFRYRNDLGAPMTEFEAQVLEVLSSPNRLNVEAPLRIVRPGGVATRNGVKFFQGERGFQPWTSGMKLAVFLGWSDEQRAFYPISGPAFVFEESATGKVRSQGQGLASSSEGRSFDEVVARIRAAVRRDRLGLRRFREAGCRS